MPFPAPFLSVSPRRRIFAIGAALSIFLMVAACLTTPIISPVWAADNDPLVATGQSPVFKGNTASARLNAVADGMARAVDQAAFSLFEIKALSDGFGKYQSLVTDHTNDFVDSYQVLAEGAFGKTYRVMLRVGVNRDALRHRLSSVFPEKPPETAADTDGDKGTDAADGAAADAVSDGALKTDGDVAASASGNVAGASDPAQGSGADTDDSLTAKDGDTTDAAAPKKNPRVLFLMSEQSLEDVDPRFWWGSLSDGEGIRTESAMAGPLTESGLKIITHDRTTPEVPLKAAIIFQPDLDNAAALDIGRAMKADAVVVGKTIVYKMPDSMDESVTSFNATVTARLLDVNTGRQLSDALETTVVKDREDAGAEKAIDQAAARTATTLAAAAEQLAAPSSDSHDDDGGEGSVDGKTDEIYLEVAGVRQLGNYIRFRRFLTEQDGVNGLTADSMKEDSARLRVGWSRGAEALADILRQARFSLFAVSVDSVNSDRITVILNPLPSSNN